VKCEVCGTELPHGAMFCGECGRAVGSRGATSRGSAASGTASSGTRSDDAVPRHPDSGMPIVAPTPVPTPRTPDTVILEPVDLQYASNPLYSSFAPDPIATPAPEAEPDDDVIQHASVEEDLPPEIVAEEDSAVEDVPARPGLPTFPWGERGSEIFLDSDELEQTLIVPRRDTGERFILQFSTGESVTVFGSGLLGRNPTPQPGEYFDQLVTISDPGKSVSKTHLEFGQEAGSFWVSDRYSGNGSVVREPESSPKRLTAGKRYRIVRGSRVDIGEQFFVVS
jgi:FHA domain